MSRFLPIVRSLNKLSARSHLSNAFQPLVKPTSLHFIVNAKTFATDAAHHDEVKSGPFLDPHEVTERIIEVIKKVEKVDKSKVNKSSKFKEDLDLDSLDAVEVVMAIEEEFAIEIPDSEAESILSIQDAVTYISGHPMAK